MIRDAKKRSLLSGLYRWFKKPVPFSAPLIPEEDSEFRNLAFTYAVIALSAKVACCDGLITREKYIAFRDSFPLSGSICAKIRSLFTLACENITPFEHYVTQIKYAFPGKQELFVSLVDRLFRIATAGSDTLTPHAERMLHHIAQILELPSSSYAAVRSRYARSQVAEKISAQRVLGITPGDGEGALKKRYRELMNHYHPDRYVGEGLSPEVEMLLQIKTSEINAAYRKLSKKAA